MANRTVNVNIKYNVNTVEVQKAQAASVAAQKATDQLRKSTEDYAKASAKAAKETSAGLKQVRSDTQSLAGGFNDLYSTVRIVFTAGIAAELVNISLNMAKLSGNVDGVNRAFQRLPNATLLLNDLQKATHGTVTDLELMQKTLMAQNYKIPLTQLGKLLEFASVKAQQTGQEVNHLVDYIVSGIGLRSIKRLDDLGFTANRLKGALGGVSLQAASMGEVVSAVTTLMNEDLKATGGFTETSKTKVEQLEIKWQKLGLTISKALTSPALLNFYTNVLDKFTAGVDYLIGGGSKGIIQQQAKEQAIKNVESFKEVQITADVLKNRQQTLDVIQQEANTTQEIIGRNNDEIKNLRARRDELTKTRRYQDREELDNIAEQINYYLFKNLTLKETIKILREYLGSVEETTSAESEGLGIIERKKAQIKSLEDQIEKTNKRSEIGLGGTLIKSLNKAQDELKKLLESETTIISDYLSNLSDLELSQMKELLNNNKQFRKIQVDNDANSHKLRMYYMDIEAQKFQEIENEKIFWAEDAAAKRRQNEQAFQDFAFNALHMLAASEYQDNQLALDHLKEKYDQQRRFLELSVTDTNDNKQKLMDLDQRYSRQRAQLERQEAERKRDISIKQAIISTAQAIAEALPNYVLAGLAAATGAIQIGVIQRQRFAKGVLNLKGPGNETSDSIPAMLSRGESVMTAQETRRSMGLLEAIKHNKIDDRILKSIDFSGGRQPVIIDQEKVVNAIRSQVFPKAPDLVKQGRTIIETYVDVQGNKKKIRSSSI